MFTASVCTSEASQHLAKVVVESCGQGADACVVPSEAHLDMKVKVGAEL